MHTSLDDCHLQGQSGIRYLDMTNCSEKSTFTESDDVKHHILHTHTYNLPTAAVNVIIKSNTIIIFTFIIKITIDRFGQQAFSQSMHAKCLKMIPFHIFKYCVGLQLVCLDEVDNQCTR